MKMPGIQGVAIANIVANPLSDKKIESRISFNDGSTWSAIVGSIVDENNQSVCAEKVRLLSTISY